MQSVGDLMDDQNSSGQRRAWMDWQDWRDDVDRLISSMLSRIDELSSRVAELEASHTELHKALNDNTSITQRVADSTALMVEWFEASRGAFKVLGALGTLAKWSAGIAAAIVSALAAWHQYGGDK